MLVLSRGLNERIIIGEDISVQIIGISQGKVKLAIKAPKQISVHREEVYIRIQNQTK
jgi:carbon storage regulator